MPFKTAADDLAENTLTFWRISQARNGTSGESIPYIVAMATLNDALETVNPARPLSKQTHLLRQELIMDVSRKPREVAAPPTPLRKPA
jgi:hypothetical protein